MSHDEDQVELGAAHAVLGYFRRNPGVADNLEGIVRWRLLDERIHHCLEETHRAIDWLVEQELLVVEYRTASGPFFRLNTQKRAKIEEVVKGGAPRRRRHDRG